MVVGIIGAGASGMAAALAASENHEVQVVLLERQARVGRKLQATGNGRCNLTNLHAAVEYYHGEESEFVVPALQMMNPEKTLNWFRDLGLYTVAEDSGKVYPYSDQANSVVDVLRLALDRPNVTLLTGAEVQKVCRRQETFVVETEERTVICDKLIIACGGLAGSKLGGTMSGYRLLAKFGHRSTRLRPSLVQLRSPWGSLAALKGVRANCYVQILHEEKLFAQSTGELQFTEYGLSGPVIFEISRDVCQGTGAWCARLDFLPQCDSETLLAELQKRRNSKLMADELLTGVLHNRLGRVLTKSAGIGSNVAISSLTDEQLLHLCSCVKAFEVVLSEPMGMDSAQVTAGGVLTKDFDPQSMESRRIPGLYACGEVLDIDGDCGGYNLQWAWSSGYCAGLHAGKEHP